LQKIQIFCTKQNFDKQTSIRSLEERFWNENKNLKAKYSKEARSFEVEPSVEEIDVVILMEEIHERFEKKAKVNDKKEEMKKAFKIQKIDKTKARAIECSMTPEDTIDGEVEKDLGESDDSIHLDEASSIGGTGACASSSGVTTTSNRRRKVSSKKRF